MSAYSTGSCLGHVQPVMPLTRALQDRGPEVACSANVCGTAPAQAATAGEVREVAEVQGDHRLRRSGAYDSRRISDLNRHALHAQ